MGEREALRAEWIAGERAALEEAAAALEVRVAALEGQRDGLADARREAEAAAERARAEAAARGAEAAERGAEAAERGAEVERLKAAVLEMGRERAGLERQRGELEERLAAEGEVHRVATAAAAVALAAAAGERDEAREGLSRVEVVKAGLLEERVRLLARSEALEARSAELEGQNARLLRVLPAQVDAAIGELRAAAEEARAAAAAEARRLQQRVERRDAEIARLREVWRELLCCHPDPDVVADVGVRELKALAVDTLALQVPPPSTCFGIDLFDPHRVRDPCLLTRCF